MRLSIHTMRRTVYDGETDRVTLPTLVGEITILDNHEPYVTILSPGKLRYVAKREIGPNIEEKEETLPITGGFMEVRGGNEVKILADE